MFLKYLSCVFKNGENLKDQLPEMFLSLDTKKDNISGWTKKLLNHALLEYEFDCF